MLVVLKFGRSFLDFHHDCLPFMGWRFRAFFFSVSYIGDCVARRVKIFGLPQFGAHFCSKSRSKFSCSSIEAFVKRRGVGVAHRPLAAISQSASIVEHAFLFVAVIQTELLVFARTGEYVAFVHDLNVVNYVAWSSLSLHILRDHVRGSGWGRVYLSGNRKLYIPLAHVFTLCVRRNARDLWKSVVASYFKPPFKLWCSSKRFKISDLSNSSISLSVQNWFFPSEKAFENIFIVVPFTCPEERFRKILWENLPIWSSNWKV